MLGADANRTDAAVHPYDGMRSYRRSPLVAGHFALLTRVVGA
ncbi:hypothetical protein [Neoaquamicrobium sediminum]